MIGLILIDVLYKEMPLYLLNTSYNTIAVRIPSLTVDVDGQPFMMSFQVQWKDMKITVWGCEEWKLRVKIVVVTWVMCLKGKGFPLPLIKGTV